MKRLFSLTFSFVATALVGLACKTLGNHYNAQVLDCGAGIDSGKFSYAEVYDDKGSKLNTVPEDAEAYLSNGSGDRKKLSWTSRACVGIPLDSKPSQFFLTVPSWKKSVVLEWNGKDLSNDVHLKSKPKLEGVLKCPSDGFYVNETLPNFITFKVSGEAEDYELRVMAYRRGSNETYQIFKKSMSEPFSGLPDSYSLKPIPEGVYLLKAGYRTLADGIDTPEVLLNDGQTCELNVLRLATVPGFNDSKILSYQPGKEIGMDLNFNEETISCIEEGSSGSCEPNSACRDVEKFSKLRPKSPVIEGMYSLYLRNRDKAGNLSGFQCRRFFVTDSAPNIDLHWARDDWNEDISPMSLPFTTLRADIKISHKSLDQNFLQSRLQCKIDYLADGKERVFSEGANCLSKSCRGKDLSTFQPCDSNFEFSILGLLTKPGFLSSVLRLTVRVDDGAGAVKEVVKNLWMNIGRSKQEIVRSPEFRDVNDTIQYLYLPDGNKLIIRQSYEEMFGVKRPSVSEVQFVTKSTTEYIELEEGNRGIKAIQTPSGRVYILSNFGLNRLYEFKNGNVSEKRRSIGQGSEPIGTDESERIIFYNQGSKTLHLQSLDNLMIIKLQNDLFKKCLFKTDSVAASTRFNRVAVICDDGIYEVLKDSVQLHAQGFPYDLKKCLSSAFDSQGNFVFYCLSKDSKFIEINLLDWDLKEFHKITKIPINDKIKQEGVYDRLGNVYIQAAKWDADRRELMPLNMESVSNDFSFDSYTFNTSSEIGYAQTKAGSIISYRGETIFFPDLKVMQADFSGFPDSIEILTPETFFKVQKASMVDWNAALIAGSKVKLQLHDNGSEILLTSDKSYSFLRNGEWTTKYMKCLTDRECIAYQSKRFLAYPRELENVLFEPGVVSSSEDYIDLIVDSNQTAWGIYSRTVNNRSGIRNEFFIRRFDKDGEQSNIPLENELISEFQSLAIRDGNLYIFGAKSYPEGKKPLVLEKSLSNNLGFNEVNLSWDVFRKHAYGEVRVSKRGIEVLLDSLPEPERSKLILSPFGVVYEIKDGFITRWDSGLFTKLECGSEVAEDIENIVFDKKDNLLFLNKSTGKIKMCLVK